MHGNYIILRMAGFKQFLCFLLYCSVTTNEILKVYYLHLTMAQKFMLIYKTYTKSIFTDATEREHFWSNPAKRFKKAEM